MVTTITSGSDDRTGQDNGHTSIRTSRRARPPEDEESAAGARFFLPKSATNGNALELGREFASEGEARVEALKLSVTYYSVQEWRPVADFAGKNPELKRQAVTKKGAGQTHE